MDNKLLPPIQITSGGGFENDKKDDEPLFEAKVNNPFSKFFKWIKNFLKTNQNITIKIPIVGILIGLSVGLTSGYKWGFNDALSKLFPNSSPILHRAISLEGTIQKSDSKKYYLKSESNLWTLKPANSTVNLSDYLSKQVAIKGNLTKEANVVEVSEIILLDISVPEISVPTLSSAELPELYPVLDWQTTQKKVLIFTSGKRKIEQEGVYLESSQINSFPQDFINYYIQELKNKGFKETLNSINPDGITVTYAKDDLFFTFGTKNKYSGSVNNKQLVGYAAFIEHN